MTFLEQRLSPKIEQGAMGGPTVPGRTKARTPDGRLRQNFLASAPIHRFDVSHGLRLQADFQAVLDAFYVVMFGGYEGFRFRDWRDYKATAANSRCTLISGSTYQLQRVHTFGGVEFLRKIFKPVAGVVITRNRSGAFTTASHTLNTATGVATISGHLSGDTYTWAGEFDLPVTFSDDEWVSTLEGAVPNLLAQSPSIPLEEIRL